MFLDSLKGLTHMHNRNIIHGNIRPEYIGFDKNTNEYLVMENLNDHSLLEKAQIQNLITKKKLYMTPELYRKLKTKNKNVKYDPK